MNHDVTSVAKLDELLGMFASHPFPPLGEHLPVVVVSAPLPDAGVGLFPLFVLAVGYTGIRYYYSRKRKV